MLLNTQGPTEMPMVEKYNEREVKVGGWCRFPMWDSVQVAAVVTHVMRIRREGVSALVLVVLRLDMLG
ncbi:unnamed protein product [Prunus armeniaca]